MRALLLPRNTGFEFGNSAATQTAEFHFPNFVSALLSAALAMKPPNFFAELKRRNDHPRGGTLSRRRVASDPGRKHDAAN